MKTNLQKVYTQLPEPKKVEFAIDEPYKKPKLRKPYFEDNTKKIRKANALKKRFGELVKKRKKVQPVEKKNSLLMFWRGLVKG